MRNNRRIVNLALILSASLACKPVVLEDTETDTTVSAGSTGTTDGVLTSEPEPTGGDQPKCGDGEVNGGPDNEQCDGPDLNGLKFCSDFQEDWVLGGLTCRQDCTYDFSACGPDPGLCGNGNLDNHEPCDGLILNGQTCLNNTAGMFDGQIKCTNCEIDISGCDILQPKCGDGKIEGGEQCEPPAVFNNEDCRTDCRLSVCGDGNLNFLGPDRIEACDDGNLNNEDGCSALCVIEFCGDLIIQPGLGESCDDGPTCVGGKTCTADEDCLGDGEEKCLLRDEDGCSAKCQLEVCGDDTVQIGLGEECDDGNLEDGDGCDADCKLSTPG